MNFWKLATSAALFNSLSPLLLAAVSLAEDEWGARFGCTPSQEIWMAEALLVGGTCALPLTAYLQQRWGTREALRRCGLSLAGVALLATLAKSLSWMILALFWLGFCASPMLALSQALLVHNCPDRRRAKAMSIWTAGQVVGILVGTALGSNDPGHIFLWISLPAGLSWWVSGQLAREAPPAGQGLHFDGLGWAILALGMLSLSLALTQIPIQGLRSWTLLCLGLSPLLLVAYLFHARRHPAPLLPLSPLQDPLCRWAVLMGMFFDALCTGQLENNYLVSQAKLAGNWQLLRGGLNSTSSLIGVALGAALCRWGTRQAFLTALGLTVAGKAGYLLFTPELGPAQLIWPFVVSGLGYWAMATILATAVLTKIRPDLLTAAASFYALTVQMGAALGVAALDAGLELASQKMTAEPAFLCLFWIQFWGTAALAAGLLFLPARSAPAAPGTPSSEA